MGLGSPSPQAQNGEVLGPPAGHAPLSGLGSLGVPKLLRKPLSLTHLHTLFPVTSTQVTWHIPLLPLWNLSDPHTLLSPLCSFPSSRGTSARVSSPEPTHMQAQGQPRNTPFPLSPLAARPGTPGQIASQGHDYPHADPCTSQATQMGANTDTSTFTSGSHRYACINTLTSMQAPQTLSRVGQTAGTPLSEYTHVHHLPCALFEGKCMEVLTISKSTTLVHRACTFHTRVYPPK